MRVILSLAYALALIGASSENDSRSTVAPRFNIVSDLSTFFEAKAKRNAKRLLNFARSFLLNKNNEFGTKLREVIEAKLAHHELPDFSSSDDSDEQFFVDWVREFPDDEASLGTLWRVWEDFQTKNNLSVNDGSASGGQSPSPMGDVVDVAGGTSDDTHPKINLKTNDPAVMAGVLAFATVQSDPAARDSPLVMLYLKSIFEMQDEEIILPNLTPEVQKALDAFISVMSGKNGAERQKVLKDIMAEISHLNDNWNAQIVTAALNKDNSETLNNLTPDQLASYIRVFLDFYRENNSGSSQPAGTDLVSIGNSLELGGVQSVVDLANENEIFRATLNAALRTLSSEDNVLLRGFIDSQAIQGADAVADVLRVQNNLTRQNDVDNLAQLSKFDQMATKIQAIVRSKAARTQFAKMLSVIKVLQQNFRTRRASQLNTAAASVPVLAATAAAWEQRTLLDVAEASGSNGHKSLRSASVHA